MTERLLKTFFTVHHRYPNPFDRRRAKGLLYVNWLVVAGWILVAITENIPALLRGQETSLFDAAVLFLTPVPLFLIYRFIQNGNLKYATWLFVGFLLIGTMPQEVSGGAILVLTPTLIAAGMLLNRQGLLIVTAFAAVIVMVNAVLQSQTPQAVSPDALAFLLLVLVIDFALLYVFGANTQEIVTGSLLDVDQLQKISEFGAAGEESEEEEQFLTQAIDLIRTQQYPFAQIYLLDDSGGLTRRVRTGLSAGTGGGRQNLNISDTNAISEAIRTQKIIRVMAEDVEARRSHLLPAMNFGVAIPLIYRGAAFGVLDVQNSEGFTHTQAAILQLLANKIAMALAYYRSREILQRSLHEQETVVNTLRSQLREFRQAGRQTVSQAWDDYLARRGQAAIGFDLPSQGTTPVEATDVPEELRAVLETGQVQLDTTTDEHLLRVPIMLRGEMLGAMAFSLPKDQVISERQLQMAQNVASRLAQALETKRLFEQSQAQALRERKASEVANLFITATDIEALLDLAAESFNQALGAVHTRVYLQPGILTDTPATSEEAIS